MLQINREIVGHDDPPHMLARNSDSAATNVNSSDELAAQLKQMKEQGGFPATVFVDTRDSLISGRPGDGGQGGAHVVNVQNVFEKDGKLYVEFTNQWSTANDHLGDRAVPVEDLFKAMEYRPPANADVPKSGVNNWIKYGIPLGLTGTAAAGYAAYRILQEQNKGTKDLPPLPNPMDQWPFGKPGDTGAGGQNDGSNLPPPVQPGQPTNGSGR